GPLGPDRQIPLDARDLFLRLLDEQLEKLGIGALLLHLHHRRRAFRRRAARRWGRLRRCGRRPHDRQRLEQIEAAARVIEHVPRIAASAADRLHVVLDADDGVGKALEILGLHHLTARPEPARGRPPSTSRIRSTTLTAFGLSGLGGRAVMRRSRGFTCSSARPSDGLSRSSATASLTFARLTMHSPTTACVTWRYWASDSL